MKKKEIIEKLYEMQGLDLEEMSREDDDLRLDMDLVDGDYSPVFHFLNRDEYSAIDLVEGAPGAYAVERCLKDTYEGDYSGDITSLLLELVLNREVTAAEMTLAEEISDLCTYALNKDDDLMYTLKSTMAFNTWNNHFLIPVHICLFLINADSGELKSYWNKVRHVMEAEIKAVDTIKKHS